MPNNKHDFSATKRKQRGLLATAAVFYIMIKLYYLVEQHRFYFDFGCWVVNEFQRERNRAPPSIFVAVWSVDKGTCTSWYQLFKPGIWAWFAITHSAIGLAFGSLATFAAAEIFPPLYSLIPVFGVATFIFACLGMPPFFHMRNSGFVEFRNQWRELTQKHYQIIPGNIVTSLVNMLNIRFSCCGMNGIGDFSGLNLSVHLEADANPYNKDEYLHNPYGDGTLPPIPEVNFTATFQIPPSCKIQLCYYRQVGGLDEASWYQHTFLNCTLQQKEACYEAIFSESHGNVQILSFCMDVILISLISTLCYVLRNVKVGTMAEDPRGGSVRADEICHRMPQQHSTIALHSMSSTLLPSSSRHTGVYGNFHL